MTGNLKFDPTVALPAIIKEQLDRLGAAYRLGNYGEFELLSNDPSIIKGVERQLKMFGITIIDSPKEQLVQKIKNVIGEMIDMQEMPLFQNFISHRRKAADELQLYLFRIFGAEPLLYRELYHTPKSGKG